jgi:hypothetical protein
MVVAGGGAGAKAGPRKFLVEHQSRCNATMPVGRVAGSGKRKVAVAGVATEPRYKAHGGDDLGGGTRRRSVIHTRACGCG